MGRTNTVCRLKISHRREERRIEARQDVQDEARLLDADLQNS